MQCSHKVTNLVLSGGRLVSVVSDNLVWVTVSYCGWLQIDSDVEVLVIKLKSDTLWLFVQTFTGDTLTTSQSTARTAAKVWQKEHQKRCEHQGDDSVEGKEDEEATIPILAGVNVPQPVFFCSIEPPSMAYQKQLEHALECLQKEDPSLKVVYL